MTQEDVELWAQHFLRICFGNPAFGLCFDACIMFWTLPFFPINRKCVDCIIKSDCVKVCTSVSLFSGIDDDNNSIQYGALKYDLLVQK